MRKLILAAALGLVAAPLAGQVRLNGAGGRSRHHLSDVDPDVQPEVRQRRDQLPVDRLGRRDPPVLRQDGRLRRHRRADDRLGDRDHPGTCSTSDRPCAVVPTYTSPDSPPREIHPRGGGGHLPRQDHQVERRAARSVNPGVPCPAQDIIVACTAPTAPVHVRLGDYLTKISPEWARRWQGHVGQLARGIGRRGNEGVAATVRPGRRARSVTSSSLRVDQQNAGPARSKTIGQLHHPEYRVGHGGG